MSTNWLTLAFISLFSLTATSFLITYLAKKGYPVSLMLLSLGIVFTIFYFFQTFVQNHYTLQVNFKLLGLLLLMGIFAAIGNTALFEATKAAPNAGLVLAIAGGMQSGLLAILAFLVFKDKLTTLQLVGLLLMILAVFLINLGTKSSETEKQQTAPITYKK